MRYNFVELVNSNYYFIFQDFYDAVEHLRLTNGPIQLSLSAFMARFGLKCVDVPSDGHCFMSCIRLFFKDFLPDVAQPTIDTLRSKIAQLDLTDVSERSARSVAQLRREVSAYFDRADFASDFVDIFIGLRSDIFNIKIIVLKENRRGDSFWVDNANLPCDDHRNHFPNHTILVSIKETTQHYQLIVPANRQIRHSISRFIMRRTAIADEPPVEKSSERSLPNRRGKRPLTVRVERKKRAQSQATSIAKQTEEQRAEKRLRDRLSTAAKRRRQKEGMATFGIAYAYDEIDESDELYAEHYLGPMNVVCSSCGALHWEDERTGNATNFTMCCQKGKVHVEPFQEPPEKLKNMFMDTQHPLHKEFLENIIKYNNAFSTASVVAETVVVPGGGPPAYKVHGQIYHKISSLYPDADKRPCFGQYFILDTDEALNERLNNPHNRDCKREVIDFVLNPKNGDVCGGNCMR